MSVNTIVLSLVLVWAGLVALAAEKGVAFAAALPWMSPSVAAWWALAFVAQEVDGV